MFSGSKAKVKQPLHCISLMCSYIRTFPIKVQYDRNLGNEMARYEAKMQIFKETTSYKQRKLAGQSPGNDKVSIVCFPHIEILYWRVGKV